MQGQDVIFSRASKKKGNDEWGTPPDIIADLKATHGIEQDVCCTAENQKCEIGFGLDDHYEDEDKVHFHRDGLAASFGQYVSFCNPAHSQLEKWLKKCRDESELNMSTVIMVVPARTGRTGWQKYVLGAPQYGEKGAAEILYVDGRISFYGKIRKPGQPKNLPADKVEYELGYAPSTFDSAIVIYRWPFNGNPVHGVYVQPKDRKK